MEDKYKYLVLHTHPNTYNLSNSIMDNAYLSFALSKIFVEVDIFLLVYILFLIWIYLVSSYI